MISNTPYFDTTEHSLSQKPALELLSKLGWEIIDYEQANILRGKKLSSVLLEDILYKQLSEINKISFQGKEYAFEQSCIQSAVQKLKPFKNDGLLPLNNELTDLLIMGTSEAQSINGSTKSFTLNYIDWNNPRKNIFYAVPEFIVERVRSAKTARPDIVLFVNGIPLGVIECKAPSEDVEQGVTQNIRNQTESYIPHLFMYCQILMAVNKNAAKYAGINEKSCTVISMSIAGGLAGAGAALYYLSGNTEFAWEVYQTLPAVGFNGIPVALLACNNPIGVIFSATFISLLDVNGMQLKYMTPYNEYITSIITAVIVYFSAFSLLFKQVLEGKVKINFKNIFK